MTRGAAAGGDTPIVMELDGELRHVSASAAALAMVGLPAEALMGRTSGEAGLPPEVVDPLERELRAAVSTGEERQLELEMPTSEGLRWLHLRLVPGGADEDAGRVTLLATDITSRKHAELRLSAGGAAFRALVEDSPDPIALIDSDLRVSFVNDALVRATGRDPSGVLGRTISEAGLFAEIAPRWEEAARTVLATGERLAIDFRFTTPDGPRWFSARLLPEIEDDRRGHVILACTDVTDRVNREAEQAALRRVATVVAREADLEEIGRVVAQEAALLLNAGGSAVYRFESESEATCIAAHPPVAPGTAVTTIIALTPASATGRTARTGEATRVEDYRRVDDPSVREVLDAGLRSGIASPLWTRGRLWGALTHVGIAVCTIGDALERRSFRFVRENAALGGPNGHPFVKLISDALSREVHEPAFERTNLGIVFEFPHGLGRGQHRFLDHVFRLGLGQTGFERHAVDEFPVRVEEDAPAFLILPVFQPAQQAASRRDKLFGICIHKGR